MFLKCSSAWFDVIPGDSESCLLEWYIIVNILYWVFIFLSLGLHKSRSIPRQYIPVFPTPSVSYLGVQYLGGIGASCGDGIGDGLFLWLSEGKVSGYWLVKGVSGEEGGCDISVSVEGCGSGWGVGAFLIPFVDYFQYLSSRASFYHNFNDPYQSTVGTMSAIFYTRIFLLEWSTPPTCHLLL